MTHLIVRLNAVSEGRNQHPGLLSLAIPPRAGKMRTAIVTTTA